MHGDVSREPAAWAVASVEEGTLTEVIYEKAAEGIAKARAARSIPSFRR